MPRPSILYAEDDENDAFLMQRAFRQAEIHYPLLIVPDGKSAMDCLSGRGQYGNREEYPLPCLVLLDVKLPGKSGLEILKWIRSEPRLSTLPVLMLTSSNQESDVRQSYALGANGYLVKPNKPGDMVAMAKAIRDYWLVLNHTPEIAEKSG